MEALDHGLFRLSQALHQAGREPLTVPANRPGDREATPPLALPVPRYSKHVEPGDPIPAPTIEQLGYPSLAI